MKQEVIVQLSNADLLERIEEEKKQMTRLRLNHAVSLLTTLTNSGNTGRSSPAFRRRSAGVSWKEACKLSEQK